MKKIFRYLSRCWDNAQNFISRLLWKISMSGFRLQKKSSPSFLFKSREGEKSSPSFLFKSREGEKSSPLFWLLLDSTIWTIWVDIESTLWILSWEGFPRHKKNFFFKSREKKMLAPPETDWNLWKFPIFEWILSQRFDYRRSISVEGIHFSILRKSRDGKKVVALPRKVLILRW